MAGRKEVRVQAPLEGQSKRQAVEKRFYWLRPAAHKG